MLTGGSFYDALYVALAERYDVHVVTADTRMIHAFALAARLELGIRVLRVAQPDD